MAGWDLGEVLPYPSARHCSVDNDGPAGPTVPDRILPFILPKWQDTIWDRRACWAVIVHGAVPRGWVWKHLAQVPSCHLSCKNGRIQRTVLGTILATECRERQGAPGGAADDLQRSHRRRCRPDLVRRPGLRHRARAAPRTG